MAGSGGRLWNVCRNRRNKPRQNPLRAASVPPFFMASDCWRERLDNLLNRGGRVIALRCDIYPATAATGGGLVTTDIFSPDQNCRGPVLAIRLRGIRGVHFPFPPGDGQCAFLQGLRQPLAGVIDIGAAVFIDQINGRGACPSRLFVLTVHIPPV